MPRKTLTTIEMWISLDNAYVYAGSSHSWVAVLANLPTAIRSMSVSRFYDRHRRRFIVQVRVYVYRAATEWLALAKMRQGSE